MKGDGVTRRSRGTCTQGRRISVRGSAGEIMHLRRALACKRTITGDDVERAYGNLGK